MSPSRITGIINDLFKEAGHNIVEDRVSEYFVNEIRKGRKLSEVLEDPYVTNRVSGGHLRHILERKEILQEYENRLKESMK